MASLLLRIVSVSDASVTPLVRPLCHLLMEDKTSQLLVTSILQPMLSPVKQAIIDVCILLSFIPSRLHVNNRIWHQVRQRYYLNLHGNNFLATKI